jgi:hypothetical protein
MLKCIARLAKSSYELIIDNEQLPYYLPQPDLDLTEQVDADHTTPATRETRRRRAKEEK